MQYKFMILGAIVILLAGIAFLGYKFCLHALTSKASCLDRLNKILVFSVDMTDKIGGTAITIPGDSSPTSFELNCCPDDYDALTRRPIFTVSRDLYSVLKKRQGLSFTDTKYNSIEKASLKIEYVIGKCSEGSLQNNTRLHALLRSENNDHGCLILVTLPGYKGNNSSEILASKFRCLLKFIENVK